MHGLPSSLNPAHISVDFGDKGKGWNGLDLILFTPTVIILYPRFWSPGKPVKVT